MKGLREPGKESLDPARRTRRHAPTGLYIKAGNGLKLRHRRVRRVVEKMTINMPWLEPGDMPAARAWAELEILGATVFAELVTNGVTNHEGEPRRLLTELRQLRQGQLAYARELGMTPAARMAIKANGTRAAVDLAAAMAAVGSHHMDSNEPKEPAGRTHRARRNPSDPRLTELKEPSETDKAEEKEEDVD